MPSFDDVKEILGFNSYYEEEKRYATPTTSQLPSRGGWYLNFPMTHRCMGQLSRSFDFF